MVWTIANGPTARTLRRDAGALIVVGRKHHAHADNAWHLIPCVQARCQLQPLGVDHACIEFTRCPDLRFPFHQLQPPSDIRRKSRRTTLVVDASNASFLIYVPIPRPVSSLLTRIEHASVSSTRKTQEGFEVREH